MSTVLSNDLGGVRYLTLNRPEKRNALNDELIGKLKLTLYATDSDTAIRAIVIRGAGSDFCSGADLASLQKIADASLEENLADAMSLAHLFRTIREVRVPVIAAVHGRALAGGCGLATACDLIVATRSARFGYPEVKIGFVPAIVMAFLRRNLSEKRAFEMATQGFEFSAETAFEIGLVNQLVDDEAFDDYVQDYASVYERVSGTAVQMTKKLLYDLDGLDFDAAVEKAASVNAEARMTEDCKKGIARFLEK